MFYFRVLSFFLPFKKRWFHTFKAQLRSRMNDFWRKIHFELFLRFRRLCKTVISIKIHPLVLDIFSFQNHITQNFWWILRFFDKFMRPIEKIKMDLTDVISRLAPGSKLDSKIFRNLLLVSKISFHHMIISFTRYIEFSIFANNADFSEILKISLEIGNFLVENCLISFEIYNSRPKIWPFYNLSRRKSKLFLPRTVIFIEKSPYFNKIFFKSDHFLGK